MGEAKHKTTRLADQDQRTRLIFESMMQQALLLAVEKLGGSLTLSVHEVDTATVGKRMDFHFDEGRRAFVFTVSSNGG